MSGGKFTKDSVSLSVIGLTGGLNSTASALNLEDNEASDLLNVDFDIFGAFKKRSGYATLNGSEFNSGATFTGLYFYKSSDGTQKLVGTCGNKFAKMDDLDGTWDDITGAITITAGNTNLFSIAVLNDILLATNDVDAPFKWTGSGNAAAADVPTNLTKARFVYVWNNYAFYANTTVSGTAHPSRLYWSTIKDPTTWTATHFADISKNDNDEITGLFSLGEKLVIFKANSIHIGIFTGDADIPFVFYESKSPTGAISGYSIQRITFKGVNVLIFLAGDGFYLFDGNDSVKISDRITTTLDGFAKNRFRYVTSGYQRFKNRYWASFSASGGTTNSRVITYDTHNNAFSYYEGHAANCFTTFVTSGEERIYFGDYGGFCYRADTGSTDNPLGVSTAISANWKSKWFSFGDLIYDKASPVFIFYHQLSSAILSFGYSYDLEDSEQHSHSVDISTSGDTYGSGVYGTATYAGSGGSLKRRSLNGRGKVIRVSFTNNVSGENFQINGFGFFMSIETVV